MTSLQDRLHYVLSRMEQAALRSGRKADDVRLVAVSKTKPAESIRAAVAAGATIIGENYIQEAREKIQGLTELEVQWHFIGRLQTNKAKYAVRLFDLIHSVDSFKLAAELNKYARKAGKIQNILIQVNISGETAKAGIEEQEAIPLLRKVAPLENLRVRGLMTMPPFFDEPEKARPYFAALRQLRDRICSADIQHIRLDELSMGMTGDFEAAVEEGATLVRVGTAIFGERT
jgi:pyridoxal phosphate enzyme (YggS family)